ncbi:MAG: holo-ACP synthase [Dehalococcoidales bacterium]|nr:holo-ACP synthase [Dehalococcoidales bacterium]
MKCIGVDIIEIHRIQQAINRWGESFLHRIYTESELRLCRKNPGRLSSRFAGKEAVMKALGTGTIGIGWKEIEIVAETGGKPKLQLYGKALEKAKSSGLTLAISLSHSKEYAIAFVSS